MISERPLLPNALLFPILDLPSLHILLVTETQKSGKKGILCPSAHTATT
jgi:hypothetical protein